MWSRVISTITVAFCVLFSATAQDARKVDSLENLIHPGISDSLRLEIELKLTDEFLFSDAEMCVEHAQRALVLAYQTDEEWLVPYLHSYIGMCYDDLGKYGEALIAYTQAIEITEDLMAGDSAFHDEYQRDLVVFLNNAGYTEFNRGNPGKALAYYVRALDLGLRYDSDEIGEVYGSIAELYLDKNDIQNAWKYANLARETSPDSAWIWYDACLTGKIYLKSGRPDSALSVFSQALSADLDEVSNYDKTVVFAGLSEANIAMGRFEDGLTMADSALQFAENLNNKVYIAEALSLRSRALFSMGNRSLAVAELDEAIEIAGSTNSILHLSSYYRQRAEQFAEMGSYNQAFIAGNQASRLSDSIRSAFESAQFSELLRGQAVLRQANEAGELQRELVLGQSRERNSRRFAIAMFICALLLAVTTYLVIRRRQSIKFDLAPSTGYVEGDDKLLFMRRMTISVAVLLIPLLIYNVVWQETLQGLWTMAMLGLVLVTHMLIRYFKWNITPILILITYPLIVFAPGSTSSPMILLWIPATFVTMAYATDSLRLQILNGLLAASSFVLFLYRIYLGPTQFDMSARPEGQVIIGIMALGTMFVALYYHRGRMFDYRFGLDKTSSFLRLIADANPNFVFAKDKDRRYTFANKAMTDAYDLPLSSIIGHTPEEVNKAFAESPHFREDDEEVLNEGVDKFIPEEKVYDSDHNEMWLRTLKKPIRNSDGEVIGLLGVSTDITGMRQSSRELRESLSLLQATINSTADGLLVVDTNNKIILTNNKFLDIWGQDVRYIGDDARKRLSQAATRLKDPEGFLERVREIISTPDAVTNDTMEFADGRIIERYSQPQRVEGKVVGRVWSFRDVTSREIAVQNLKRSEERYRTSLEDNLFSIVRVSNGKFLSTNKAFEDLTGYSGNEIRKITLQDVVHPEDAPRFAEFARQIISGVRPNGNVESRVIRKDGAIRHILASIKGYYDTDGIYLESTITAADITQLKEVENALADSESRYRSLVEASPDGILLTDMDGVITFASRRFLEMTGFTGENSPVGKNMLEFAEPEEYRRAERDLAGALASSGPAFARYWVRTSSGKRRRVELGTRLIRDIHENPVGVIVVVRDITEKAMAEEVLRASESRYRVLFENTFDGFVIFGSDGTIEDVNQSAVDLMNYPTVDVMRSRRITDLFPELGSREEYIEITSGNSQKTNPIRLVGMDFFGNEIYAEINLSIVPMPSGEKITCAIKDIGERVVLENKEKELESQEAQLDALNRQLASLSIFNSQKMKLLSEIQADIDEARRKASSQVQGVLQRVGRKIDANLNEQEDMMAFKIQFEKIHPNFFRKLTELCPKLTSHDLKYCAYMRLNMTTQDIANLLYVEKKSVEMSKYRIKKKLGLDKGARLSEFLRTI